MEGSSHIGTQHFNAHPRGNGERQLALRGRQARGDNGNCGTIPIDTINLGNAKLNEQSFAGLLRGEAQPELAIVAGDLLIDDDGVVDVLHRVSSVGAAVLPVAERRLVGASGLRESDRRRQDKCVPNAHETVFQLKVRDKRDLMQVDAAGAKSAFAVREVEVPQATESLIEAERFDLR